MDGRRVLLVEGSDDEHVLKHICGRLGLPDLGEVKPQDGVDNLLKAIPVQLKAASGPEDVVGVVIDANAEPAARWRSLRDQLIQVGYREAPSEPDPNGTVVQPPGGTILPRVGIWMMPDNSRGGTLEDFLRCLVPEQSPLFDHVVASVESIPDQRFRPSDRPKVLIHTWLAWQETPGMPYGSAITAGFFDLQVPEIGALASWLNRLYCRAE